MSESRPLLAFPPSTIGHIPAGPPRFIPRPHHPTPARQGIRLTPQFASLKGSIAAGRTNMGASTTESDPELVVVFDVAGSVDRFVRAVSGIEGLEFLAELAEEEQDPDEDFYIEEDGVATDDGVPEAMYLVMSNAKAVDEIIRLFELWQANPEASFDRGLAPLKQAFAMLRAIRRWGPADRIRETGLLKAWAEDVAVVGGQGSARVEIELWFRGSPSLRASVQAEVERLVRLAKGTVVSSSVVTGIEYHAILADLPYDQVHAVLDNGPHAIELLKTESVMLMAPARPMSIPSLALASDLPDHVSFPSTTGLAPRVALLDGLPLSNHSALSGRLVIDDPDECAVRYSSGQQHHGTGMASLICHGDLAESREPLSTPLYVRPIMEPHPFYESEVILQDHLLVDLIHRAFHRMFEGDGDHPPAAPSVRIINLSLGDPSRIFARRMSPLAKMLDWLALKYNVLIFVSAGNHPTHPQVPLDVVDSPLEFRRAVLKESFARARHRRLLSPAEAVNALTIGALHADSHSVAFPDTVLDATDFGMPAGYSAIGFGHRRSVKPEVLLPGGRKLFLRPTASSGGAATLAEAQHSATGPGLLVAAPDRRGGAHGTAYSVGTSNATALATRAANEVFDLLADLRQSAGEGFPIPDAQYDPVLTKALIVHSAQWGTLANKFREVLNLDPRKARREITQLLGYGPIDPMRLGTGARTRAVLIGAGSIGKNERQTFSFPLPPTLAATTDWRRLTVTLAWLSPINPRSQVHRMARLLFHSNEALVGVTRREADHNAVRRGTVQHEVFEGHDAVAFVQGDAIVIEVDCRIDAGALNAPVRFGIAASLEMAATVQADIHLQVQQQLRIQLQQRQQVASNA